MGANAQTTVQKFVDGAVLTAAQQNTSAATGVPVFATTVTRDAAFGGANKVLAEGQLAYIEATNVVEYYDGAAWATVGPSASAVSAQGSSYVATQQTTASASYVGLTTAQTVTLTTGTAALVIVTATMYNTATYKSFVSFAISGATTTAASDAYSAMFNSPTNNHEWTITAMYPVVVNAGSNTFTAQYRVFGGTATVLNRNITVLAVS